MASDIEHDRFLHAIRLSPLEPHERDIRNFYYWHDRIVVLKQAFDESPGTHSPAQLWHDRRDKRQWYTLWGVLFFGTISFGLGFAQVVLAGVQLHQYSLVTESLMAPADRPSFTETPPKASTSATAPKAEKRSDHNIGPGEIAGITIAVVTLFNILSGLLMYMLRRRGGLVKAYRP